MADASGSDDRSVTEYEVQDVEKANATGKQPVVFVHGLWLLPNSWDRWREAFEEAGTLPPAGPTTLRPPKRRRRIRRCSRTSRSARSPITTRR